MLKTLSFCQGGNTANLRQKWPLGLAIAEPAK
jgi:hypothetical protein